MGGFMGSLTTNSRLAYNDLVKSFRENPRDIETHPTNAALPKWYFVSVRNGDVYVSNSKIKRPSTSISVPRKLMREEFDTMYDLHRRRERGDSVAQMAQSYTQNSSYWFGVLFAVEHGE
jgi:hypothetical protein